MSQRKPLAEHISNALAALVEQQLVEFAACWPDDQPAQAAHRVLLTHWAEHAAVRLVDSPDGELAELLLVVQLVGGEAIWWPLCRVHVDQLAEVVVPDDVRSLTEPPAA